MFGIYSKMVNSLPDGLGTVFRPTLGPAPEGPGRIFRPCWDGAKITHTMADSRVENWERILWPYVDKVHSVLEIGSHEGQSALFWSNFFNAKMTCIDNWAARCESLSARRIERHFDANLGGHVEKIKSESTPALHSLGVEGRKFDLIYIDGDHSRDQVMIDSLLAWRCLNPWGLMIWDDYRDYLPSAPPENRPTPAIDAFVALQRPHVTVLADTGQQLFVIKG